MALVKDEQVKKKIGVAIKVARLKSGITVDEMARKMEVSTQSVWNWESGRTNPTAVGLIKLKQILGENLEL